MEVDGRIIFTTGSRLFPLGHFPTLKRFEHQKKEIRSTRRRYDRMTSSPVICLIILVASTNSGKDWLLWGVGKRFSIGLYPRSVNSFTHTNTHTHTHTHTHTPYLLTAALSVLLAVLIFFSLACNWKPNPNNNFLSSFSLPPFFSFFLLFFLSSLISSLVYYFSYF